LVAADEWSHSVMACQIGWIGHRLPGRDSEFRSDIQRSGLARAGPQWLSGRRGGSSSWRTRSAATSISDSRRADSGRRW